MGLVRGKILPAGLHAVEASHVSISSLSSFRAAIGRAVWSSKMPMASTLVLLNLLDGPVGVDPAYHIIRARFSMLRRYLACWPDEVPRVYRMLDLIARGAKGHGPIHLLLDSATQIGFAWVVLSKVGSGSLCLLLGCLLVQFNIFALLFCKLGISRSLLVLGSVCGYERFFTTTYLSSPEREIKCC